MAKIVAFVKDTELWKLSGLGQFKPAERKKLSAESDALRELNIKITRTILELKSRSLPLSATNVKLEFNRDPKKRIQQNNKSILDWYPEFITAKEREIGEGINSYRSTHEHFKEIRHWSGRDTFAGSYKTRPGRIQDLPRQIESRRTYCT